MSNMITIDTITEWIVVAVLIADLVAMAWIIGRHHGQSEGNEL